MMSLKPKRKFNATGKNDSPVENQYYIQSHVQCNSRVLSCNSSEACRGYSAKYIKYMILDTSKRIFDTFGKVQGIQS